MPGEVKLKPCPFCGGEAFSTNAYDFEVLLNRNSPAFSPHDLHRVSCPQCHCVNVTAQGEGDAEAARLAAENIWNRRTPSSMTSVIEWTRYDGTPETLPDKASRVLLSRDSANYYVNEAFFMMFSNGNSCWQEDLKDFSPQPGDLWACIPEPPERMEAAP